MMAHPPPFNKRRHEREIEKVKRNTMSPKAW
jgi:hypothetical protein